MSLETDLEKLRAALRNGYLSVQYQDRKVTFRDTKELQQAIESIEAQLNPNPQQLRKLLPYSFGRGYQQ